MISTPGASDRACGRVHVLLLPGFAGFDALGQLEYFSGMTTLLRDWKRARAALVDAGPALVLHYFDSFPTASVATRARRLRQYLGKRIGRAQFMPPGLRGAGDALVLVGHSTGGLDIRLLLSDLAKHPDETIGCDALAPESCPTAGDLLGMIAGVVFLSVPQWGTNLADWLSAHALRAAGVIRGLRVAAATARLPLVDDLQDRGTGVFGLVAGSQLGLAVADALNETDPASYTNPEMTPAERTATADECRALLRLWLRHMASDFHAIQDLTAVCQCEHCLSPAHANDEARALEAANWRRWRVATRSYATIAPPPGDASQGSDDGRVDHVYRWSHGACSSGPFSRSVDAARWIGGDAAGAIAASDSDGIVNTASMFWPDGPGTRLVPADHMDIVGHHEAMPALVPGRGRLYRAYDLLGSGTRFDASKLRAVWHDVFDFCARVGAGAEAGLQV